MAVYLGLGSNLGDGRSNLRAALAALQQESIMVDRVSPIVESPALLPAEASPDWNRPFLNLVAECHTDLSPERLLDALKRIERALGRADPRRWAPRPIDIDILLYDDLVCSADHLAIPHPALARRNFVLTPLAALKPSLTIPGQGGATAWSLNAVLDRRIPLWMGIVNLTPDSFSDGGQNTTWAAVEARIDAMIASGVHFLDFGAESTRPGAAPITADQEWSRLEPMLSRIVQKLADDPIAPAISVDTYHPEVAKRALALGVDVINDVSGLTQPEMIELAVSSAAEFVAMHNLSLPADPNTTLATDTSAVDQVADWLDRRIEQWQSRGLDPDRIVFDPGIGFGKNPLQSLELLRDIERFGSRGLRLLVGHSRKSFLSGFTGADLTARDLATVGGSLALCARGVDILRVHDVAAHTAAYRGWAHLQPGN